MTNAHPKHWTEPHGDDALLKWRFCDVEAELGIRSTYDPIIALASSGVSGGGNTQTDDRLVRRGICTVDTREIREPARMKDGTEAQLDRRADGEGPAAKVRRIDALLGTLTPRERDILWEAYGPNYALWRENHKARLGQWPGVALVTPAAIAHFEAWRSGVAARAEVQRAALGDLPLLRCRPQERRCYECKGTGREEKLDVWGKARACERCGGSGWLTSQRLTQVLKGKAPPTADVQRKRVADVVKSETIVAASKADQAARIARFGWLLHEASPEQLDEIRDEAAGELFVASNRWRDARGRRQKVPRHATREDALAALDAREEAAGR